MHQTISLTKQPAGVRSRFRALVSTISSIESFFAFNFVAMLISPVKAREDYVFEEKFILGNKKFINFNVKLNSAKSGCLIADKSGILHTPIISPPQTNRCSQQDTVSVA